MEITDGHISKPHTYPYEVIAEYQNNIDRDYICKQEIKYLIENEKPDFIIEALKNLLDG
jgi:hypothetical protein